MSSNSELAVSNSGNKIDSNSLPIISFHSSLKDSAKYFSLEFSFQNRHLPPLKRTTTSKNDLNHPKSKEKSFPCHFLKFGDGFFYLILSRSLAIYLKDDLQNKSIGIPFIKCQHVVKPTCKPYSRL